MHIQNVRLGDFAKRVKRDIPINDDKEYRTLGCRLYGKGVYQRDTKCGKEIKAKRMYLVKENDFVINRIWAQKGSAGIVSRDIEGSVVTNDFPVFELDTRIVVPEYIGYYVKTEAFQKECSKHSRGTSGRQRLNPSQIPELRLPLVNLATQKAIISEIQQLEKEIDVNRNMIQINTVLNQKLRMGILLKAFRGELTSNNSDDEDAISLLGKIKNRKQYPNQHELKKTQNNNQDGVFQLPDNWVWTTIGEIEFFLGSGSTPRGGREVYVNEGIPFIRSQNVYPGGIRTDDIAYITPEIHEKMSRTKVQPHDILLNITGASIGRCTYVPMNFEPANVNQHVCIIRTSDLIHPAYLSWFLNSVHGQNQIMASQSGATREGLNYSQLRGIHFPLAPFREQKEIVRILESFFENSYLMERKVRESNEKFKQLEQSILNNAFSGRLVQKSKSMQNS